MAKFLKVSLAFLVLLMLAATARAQTVTPQLGWTTPDALAKVTTYTTTLQIGTGTITQVTPTCVAAGTGTSCTLSLAGTGFSLTVATKITVTVVDPATGLSASGSFNYTPGTPPASFTLTLAWKVTVP